MEKPETLGQMLATVYLWSQPQYIPTPVRRNDKIPGGLVSFLRDIFQVGRGHPGVKIRFRNDAEWTPVLPDLKVGFEDNGIEVEEIREDKGHTLFILRWAPGDLSHVPEIADMSPGLPDR